MPNSAFSLRGQYGLALRTARWLSFWVSLVACSLPAAADSFREQVEADWQRHDEARMIQIRQPGLIRFPTGELQWPGLGLAERGRLGRAVRVPKLAAPTIDGRLDEPCWQQAARVPLGPADQPVQPAIRLCYDADRIYLGASFPSAGQWAFQPVSTAADAAGAVDGVKNGRYGFHTSLEPNPWWQVDLGRAEPIGRIVVYNRLDYAPGLRNADSLVILVSEDGRSWTKVYQNQGRPFGGATDGRPLVVDFQARPPAGMKSVQARFVRIQLASPEPVFFHLDEVEIYGPGDAKQEDNLALGRPADQSSRSPWSKGGDLAELGPVRIGLLGTGPKAVVTINGQPAPADQAAIAQREGMTTVEAALRLEGPLAPFPGYVRPFHSQPTALVPSPPWRIVWPERLNLGFGRNRLALELQADTPLALPVQIAVETVVFTPLRPERQVVLDRRLEAAGRLVLDFQIAQEGAAALVVTARQGTMQLREGRAVFIAPVEETLNRAQQLAAEQGTRLPEEAPRLREQLRSLQAREKAEGPAPAARAALYRQARWLARRVAFANPRLRFEELLFVKRFTQETYPDVCLNHMPWVSRPGGDICILTMDGSDRQGPVRALLNGALGPGHVHGIDLGWDADRVVFGYAKAKSHQPPPGWLDRRTSFELRRSQEPTHIFEIGIDGRGLRQLTRGQWSDLDPTYLPNGDIVFVSERCGYSLQCNEYDKDETSTNLYVMRPDGTNIRRMSVTKDGDYLPHTLDDGTVGYTRWEYHERGWAHIQSLWTIRPDGTGADALFKQHLNDPWAVEDCRSIPGSNRLVGVATGHHTLPAGPVILINPRKGMNSSRAIQIVTPGVLPPEGGMSGRAVPQGGLLGTSGYYMHPWPLSETTFLVSYGAFGHDYGVGQEIDPAGYAIYLIDVYGTKELIYRDPGISSFHPIPLQPRPRPPILPDTTDPSVPYAVLSVQNAAKGAPGIDPKKVKYLRIAEPVAWPYCNTYGGQRYEPDVKSVMINWNPVCVLGDVPVEADGSAQFRVPADRAVYFQLLDENRMELRRMRSFISFQPGERRGCVGCHETREESGAAPTLGIALAREPSIPTPPPWGDRPISFLRDVQPVFDKYCVSCHSGLKPGGGLDFSGGLTARYNRCYDTILAHKLIARSNVGDDARITMPLEFGSHRSKLTQPFLKRLREQPPRISQEDFLRIVIWIDANGPYHDGFINKRPAQIPYDLPNDRELEQKLAAIHGRRCSGCHQPGEVTRLDWIDLKSPQESLFLASPLSKHAGGRGKCGQPVYQDPSDPDYRQALELVQAAVRKAWEAPRRDLKALVPPPPLVRR
ncbi:MAG: HzsA-related protein [Thermoguttaceae bacterium]